MKLKTCFSLILYVFYWYVAEAQNYHWRQRGCKDVVDCRWYVRLGYCRSRSPFYQAIAGLCKKSCGLCTPVKKPARCQDRHSSCRYWVRYGYCFSNKKYMSLTCRKSCGFCGGCSDLNNNCRYWAQKGECRKNPRYMLQNCRKSCRVCGTKPKPKPKPKPRPRPTKPPKTTIKSIQPPIPVTTIITVQPPVPSTKPTIITVQPPIPVEPSTTKKPIEPPIHTKQPPIPVEPSTTKKPIEPPIPTKQPPIPVEPGTTKKPTEPPIPTKQPPIPVEPATTKKPTEPPVPTKKPPIPVEPSTTKKPVEPPIPPIPPNPIKPLSTKEPPIEPKTNKPSKTDPPPIPVIPEKNVTVATFPPETASLNSDKCGLPSINHIVGGNVSKPGEWPWMVALALKTAPNRAICGASLLSDRWILTAAHCFRADKTAQDYIVRVGEFDLAQNGEEIVMNIDNLIKHENYNPATKDYDIALLHLKKRVKFSRTIRPVCLASSNSNYPDGKACMVAGWGYRHEWLLGGPDKLHAVQVPIVNYNKCKQSVKELGHSLSDRMICAGLIEGGKDSCKGDSGGPLMCRPDDGGAWQQVGIVSWGVGCARPNRYGVYTEVSKVFNWVDKRMNPFTGVLP